MDENPFDSHSMAAANFNKSVWLVTNTTASSKYIPRIFIFENLLHKKGLKGGISIYAEPRPPRYVLWCWGIICHQPDTFIKIGCGHTVVVDVVWKLNCKLKITSISLVWKLCFLVSEKTFGWIDTLVKTSRDCLFHFLINLGNTQSLPKCISYF